MANQRKLWAKFVAAGGTAKASALPAAIAWSPTPFTGVVLGIDPSLRGTGIAVVEFGAAGARRLLDSRIVRNPVKLDFMQCLAAIHEATASIAERWKPRHVAVEETIYVQNFRTAQILGAARGAAIAVLASQLYPIFEYAPRRIKMAVAGNGAASKDQVGRTVRSVLGLPDLLDPDESDAAAAALCHGFTWREEAEPVTPRSR